MDVKSALDTITSFILDPSNESRKPFVKGFAWATTIILGIGTFGLAQGLSALWRHLRKVDNNEIRDNTNRLFQDAHQSSSKDSLQVAQTIFETANLLWEEVSQESDAEKARLVLFINKIQPVLLENSHVLTKIDNDQEALDILFQRKDLRIALVQYAKANSLENLLEKHLIFLTQKFYDEKGKYIKLRDTFSDKANILISPLKDLLEEEMRSLNEVMDNKKAIKILNKKSALFSLFLLFMGENSSAKEAEYSQKSAAAILGEKHGKDNADSLVEKLGLQEFENDEVALAKEARKCLLKNHPDRNPDGEKDLVQAATTLLNMLKQGVYSQYKNAYDTYRKRKKK